MTDVNVHAAIVLAKSFRLPANRIEGANIVFVSSIAGLVGTVGQVAYSATKGALDAMTKSMAIELARDGIRVNCIAPGHIRTSTVAASRSLWARSWAAAAA